MNTKSTKIYVSDILKNDFAENEVANYLDKASKVNNYFVWAWLEHNIYEDKYLDLINHGEKEALGSFTKKAQPKKLKEMLKNGLEKFEVVEVEFSIEKLSDDISLNKYQAILSTAGKKLEQICSDIPNSLKQENRCLIVPFDEKVYLIQPLDNETNLEDVESCLEGEEELISIEISNSMN